MSFPHMLLAATVAAGSAGALVSSGPVVNDSNVNAPVFNVSVTGAANFDCGVPV